MKIILDLEESFNHYHWEDPKELEEYIKEMLNILWKWYGETIIYEYEDTEIKTRFYDILDMFNSFEIKEQ